MKGVSLTVTVSDVCLVIIAIVLVIAAISDSVNL